MTRAQWIFLLRVSPPKAFSQPTYAKIANKATLYYIYFLEKVIFKENTKKYIKKIIFC